MRLGLGLPIVLLCLTGCETSSVRLYSNHDAIDPSAELRLLIPDVVATIEGADLSYGVAAIGSAVEATFWHGYDFDERRCDGAVFRRLGTRTHKLAHLHRVEEDEPPDLLLPSEVTVKVPPGQVNLWFKYQIGTENRSQFSRSGWFGGSFVAEEGQSYEMRLVYANVLLDRAGAVLRRHSIPREQAIKRPGFDVVVTNVTTNGEAVASYVSQGDELKAGEAVSTFTSACEQWVREGAL